ncbi:MAG: hypothetical protein ACKOHK_15900, partial [Planctomycetia bacterium]
PRTPAGAGFRIVRKSAGRLFPERVSCPILTVVDAPIVTISTLERGAAAESTACQDAATPPAPEILSP